jgi:DNA-binding response OmpR family regulator
MSKILIVEDEIPMLQGLRDNLEFENYTVDTAEEGEKGLDKVLNNQYDLILLDVMLPNVSGFDICKAARKNGIDTPIIMLTAKGEEIDKVLGLELGADDYMTKPFSLRELLARIKAVIRRTSSGKAVNDSEQEIEIGRLKVNFKSYEATVEGEPVKMSHKEVEVLHYLYNHSNETIDRIDLMSEVWGIDNDVSTRTIDNFILKLRQKIEVNSNSPKIIHTVHGIGYKMVI